MSTCWKCGRPLPGIQTECEDGCGPAPEKDCLVCPERPDASPAHLNASDITIQSAPPTLPAGQANTTLPVRPNRQP